MKHQTASGDNAKKVISYVLLVLLSQFWFACKNYAEPPETNNPSANGVLAGSVLTYLGGLASGGKILSGQQNLTWDQSIDMVERVKSTTGLYPAIQGFDFMDYVNKTGTHTNADNQTVLAIQWWTNAKATGKHGLVTFCWHWRDPGRTSDNFYKYNYEGSVAKGVGDTMHIPLKNGAFDPTTAIGAQMKADMDFIASELKIMKDAGVPVLWRPLHEGGGSGAGSGSGAWFWWGQDGGAAYNALYVWMHDYFTNVKGLDNLIWVWNGQGSSFYPGSSYADIGGWDIYSKGDHGSQKSTLTALRSITGNKLSALTEVGSMPDPDNLASDSAAFVWFVTWNDGNGSDPDNNFWSGNFSASESTSNYPWNTPTLARKVYSHANVITLDELPADY